jgi:hypothetical protein
MYYYPDQGALQIKSTGKEGVNAERESERERERERERTNYIYIYQYLET